MLLLVDLDGVVYRGADPVPGVAAVLAARAAVGDDVVYVTNNSMHYRADYVTRLTAMGAPVRADRVVSSGRATALHLTELGGISRVLAVGMSGLRRELSDVGLDVVDGAALIAGLPGGPGGDGGSGPDGYGGPGAEWTGLDGFAHAEAIELAGHPDAVVVGMDLRFTYRLLAFATDVVRAGARLVATNRDPVFPSERRIRPGAGSIVRALEAATGQSALSIGKPEPHLLEAAAHAAGHPVSEAVMIGDSLVTDVAAAHAVGARSVLMLTGVTTRPQVDALPADRQPTAIAADAAELAAVLEELARG